MKKKKYKIVNATDQLAVNAKKWEENIMKTKNEKVLRELQEKVLEEQGHITIGDASKVDLLELIREDMPLENILIGLYNMIKINQYKIKDLETNLNLLATRIYDNETDFSKEEVETIKSALENMDIESLNNVKSNKDYITDDLYVNLEMMEQEPNYDEISKSQNDLMNKIKYPTRKMNLTFNNLVNKAMEEAIAINKAIIDIRNNGGRN